MYRNLKKKKLINIGFITLKLYQSVEIESRQVIRLHNYGIFFFYQWMNLLH